jgi:long-subunit acyl-CoA synthetase (AMP-forming)
MTVLQRQTFWTRSAAFVIASRSNYALGKEQSADIVHDRKPTPEILACIVSGSKDNAKGVCISHANTIASVGGRPQTRWPPKETYLTYLPLAHASSSSSTPFRLTVMVGVPARWETSRRNG